MGYDMYTQEDGGCADPTHGDHYLRRAIGNGVELARALVNAGMGSWGPDDVWKAAEERGFPTEIEGEYPDEWQIATDAYLRDRRGAPVGIAVYKLCNTNDGWWVTKEECQEALAIWRDKGPGCLVTRNDVIPFLQAGADHDGFRVH